MQISGHLEILILKLLCCVLISSQIRISDLHQWKFTADNYLENKELGRDWKHGNKKWETKQIGDTDSVLVADAESGNALSLIMDSLQIGIEVNPAVEDQTDTKQKWDLAKDKRTGWMKLKKPNGFFLEISECGNDLFIQGIYYQVGKTSETCFCSLFYSPKFLDFFNK